MIITTATTNDGDDNDKNYDYGDNSNRGLRIVSMIRIRIIITGVIFVDGTFLLVGPMVSPTILS